MDVSRRTFIKTTLVGGAGASVFGFSLAPVYAQTQGLKIERTTETRSTCPYCSVSCGVTKHLEVVLDLPRLTAAPSSLDRLVQTNC